jgi:hypothetical protein
MMKKLLVLALVLSVASLANAGLSLQGAGNVVNVVSDDAAPYVANLVYVLPVDGTGDLTGQIVNMPGSLSVVTDFGIVTGADIGWALGDIHVIQFLVGSSTVGALTSGVHFTGTANTDLLQDGPVVAAYLLSEDFSTVLGTLFTTPEPMTMVLLGLGGLFLRRKK